MSAFLLSVLGQAHRGHGKSFILLYIFFLYFVTARVKTVRTVYAQNVELDYWVTDYVFISIGNTAY